MATSTINSVHGPGRTLRRGTTAPDPLEQAAAAPAAAFMTRKVGPLTCRFADVPDDVRAHPIPTVESLAQVAHRLIGAHVGPYDETDPAARAKAFTAAGPTRRAAEGAVRTQHLKDAYGAPHTKAAYAPLVTLVRKQLLADLRAGFKASAKAAAEAKRQSDKRAREADRAKAAVVAKAAKTVHCAVLPETSKPSKALSKDATRPILTHAHLTQDPEKNWQLVCTDSYQASILPLQVHGDAGLRDCTLDTDTVKAIEKAGAFRITKDGLVEPVSYTTAHKWVDALKTSVAVPQATVASSVRYAIITGEQFPLVRDDGRKPRKGERPGLDLQPEPPASRRMEITFNAKLLAQIADAIGSSVTGVAAGPVTITFDADCFTKREDGVREWNINGREVRGVKLSPTIRVAGRGDSRAHLMPIRPKA